MKYTIEGGSLPVLTINLEAGEKLISEAGGRTWCKGDVTTENKAEGGAGKAIGRLFSGESLFMSTYTANGPSEIAFTNSFPGTIVAKELGAGESIIAQKSAFLCGTYGIQLEAYVNASLKKGFLGGEGFIMQKVTGPGTAFFELDGYCKEYDLAPGEKLTIDTGVLALMDESCNMDVQMVKGVKNMLFGGEGLFDTTISGPGKVCLQSMSMPKLAQVLIPFLPLNKGK